MPSLDGNKVPSLECHHKMPQFKCRRWMSSAITWVPSVDAKVTKYQWSSITTVQSLECHPSAITEISCSSPFCRASLLRPVRLLWMTRTASTCRSRDNRGCKKASTAGERRQFLFSLCPSITPTFFFCLRGESFFFLSQTPKAALRKILQLAIRDKNITQGHRNFFVFSTNVAEQSRHPFSTSAVFFFSSNVISLPPHP